MHVRPGHQGRGVGARLMAEIAAWCRTHHPDCGLYLWVLAQNEGAQRFYERRGYERVGEIARYAHADHDEAIYFKRP